VTSVKNVVFADWQLVKAASLLKPSIMLLKVFLVKKDLACQHGSLDNSENALR